MRPLVGVVFVALALAPGRARAQEATEAERARAHDVRAAELYEAGDFGRALMELGSAQDLAPSPARVFEMARCQEARGNREAAMQLYRAVAGNEEVPPALRARARERQESLRAASEAEGPEAGGQQIIEYVTAPTEAAQRGGISPAAFYSMLGVTAASGIALTVLSVVLTMDHAEFEELAWDCEGDTREAEDLQARGRAMALTADVLMGVTSAAAVTTIVLAIFTRWGRTTPAVAFSPGPSRSGLGLAWGF